jgi:hypothetical protein
MSDLADYHRKVALGARRSVTLISYLSLAQSCVMLWLMFRVGVL